MNIKDLERMFNVDEGWVNKDCMDDAHQALYDYEGSVPQDEDVADWMKTKRIEARKLG